MKIVMTTTNTLMTLAQIQELLKATANMIQFNAQKIQTAKTTMNTPKTSAQIQEQHKATVKIKK